MLRGVVAAAAVAAVGVGAVAHAATTRPAAPTEVVLDDGLLRPTALAFSPRDGSLWIVNDRGVADDTVVVTGLETSRPQIARWVDDSRHYLNGPTGIAFSPRYFEHATSALTGGGPTLWTSDRKIFRGSRSSHLDMVHKTQPALGIAPGANTARREYWVVNGGYGSLDRYFFNKPHRLGGNDHSDGVVYRYAAGELLAVADVPSHLAFDAATGTVYVADTGNGRIARLRAGPVAATPRRRPGEQRRFERLFQARGGRIESVVGGLAQPSGLILRNRHLIVGEFATGWIHVFTLAGAKVAAFDTGLGQNALMGLAVARDGTIYFVDWKRSRVLRLRLPATLP